MEIKNFDQFINESKSISIDSICVDYNDTEMKILKILSKNEAIAELKQKDKDFDGSDLDDYKDTAKFYFTICTKNNSSVPIKKGSYAVYPVEYDTSNYYGLELK